MTNGRYTFTPLWLELRSRRSFCRARLRSAARHVQAVSAAPRGSSLLGLFAGSSVYSYLGRFRPCSLGRALVSSGRSAPMPRSHAGCATGAFLGFARLGPKVALLRARTPRFLDVPTLVRRFSPASAVHGPFWRPAGPARSFAPGCVSKWQSRVLMGD